MANAYKQYSTDKNLEKSGFLYIHNIKTEEYPAECYVLARAGGSNIKFTSAIEQLWRPHRNKKPEKVAPEIRQAIMVEAFAEAVVLDWEGVFDQEDNELPYSKENVVKLFTDLPDLFDVIQAEASDLSNYLMEEVERDVKN